MTPYLAIIGTIVVSILVGLGVMKFAEFCKPPRVPRDEDHPPTRTKRTRR